MKLAVSGKGGVGKTSIAALLIRRLVEEGRNVLAVDADPDTNLAAALDFPSPETITPIAEMKGLIFERMGTRPDAVGAYFKLNPRVDDIPDKYCIGHDGVRLIVMGMVRGGGKGCACPENAFLKSVLSHLLLGPDEDIVVDMEAGLEHLGRGTVAAVDGLLVVVEPSLRSLDTLDRVIGLAADIGLKRCWALANKVRSDEERAFFAEAAAGHEFIGYIPYSDGIVRGNRGQGSVRDVEPNVRREVDRVLEIMAGSLSAR